jgi:predicted extracellular nuclease
MCFGLLLQANTSFAAGVVISQVYGGGGNSGATIKNDFIEVFNAGTTAVSVNGWSVQYASSAGSTWASTSLPNTTLQPGQYLLVQEAAGTGGTVNLTPDVLGSIAMSATAGKVALVNTTTALSGAIPSSANIIDAVAYGTGSSSLEGAPTGSLSATTAAVRASSGCVDTNTNSSDFAVTTPNPRNTLTPLNPCGGGVGAAAIVPTCTALALNSGVGGTTTATATDADSIVNGVTITSGAVSGISLGTLTPASSIGGTASVPLNVLSSAANGIYPVVLNFTNNDSQNASCTLNINIGNVSTHIYDIQGSGNTSPLVGTTKTVDGIVTMNMANGFYMQDAIGDGDVATSDGIFVFTSTAPTVSVGNSVRVTGTVVEFSTNSSTATNSTITEISGPTIALLTASNPLPAPVVISLPTATVNELERYEGMLVTFSSPLTVSQNYFQGRYGQVTLSNGRLIKPTNVYSAGSAQAIATADFNARNILILDDGLFTQNPNPTPYIGLDNTLRAGDTVTNLTGIIDYGLITSSSPGPTAYKLQPSVTPTVTRANARTTSPESVGGNIKVSAANLLNYFTTVATGGSCAPSNTSADCRGADTAAELTRQRTKMLASLSAINADVFGFMEVQNNGETTLLDIVSGLNSLLGAGTYAIVPKPTDTGGDAIRVAMIYKPAKLTLVGSALSDSDPVHKRPPMAQTFSAINGEKFSVIVNHFKSKGSCPTTAASSDLNQDQGDGQGCWNLLRNQQSERLRDAFIPLVQSTSGDNDVLVIGDLNAYGKEDPITTLTNAGMVNQLSRFLTNPYSYVFDGEAGYIDHAIATASLSSQVSGATEWHINADEPFIIDYNLEFKQPACATCGPDYYSATPYRSSDHDPLIIGLSLQAPQSLTFNVLADKTLGDADFTVSATSNQGLVVGFTSQTPSVCSVTTNGSVHLLNTGVCSISATQAGNADYLPAQLVRNFSVNQGALTSQSISFNALPNKTMGDAPFALNATASSGLAVTYTAQTPTICSVSGNTVNLLQAGTCSIIASQSGNSTYAIATDVTQTFTITSSIVPGGSDSGDVPIAPIWLLLEGLGLVGVIFGLKKQRG